MEDSACGQRELATPPSPVDEDDQNSKTLLVDAGTIVPKRRGLGASSHAPILEPFEAEDRLWSSQEFWKGIVVGAAIVLLVKTAFAIQAPYGVDWYGF